jgi:hypothetical protein
MREPCPLLCQATVTLLSPSGKYLFKFAKEKV